MSDTMHKALTQIANLDPSDHPGVERGTIEWYASVANSAKLLAQTALKEHDKITTEQAIKRSLKSFLTDETRYY